LSADEDLDLIIVADTKDELAQEVAKSSLECGQKTRILDPYSAAQIFSISVEGKQTVVEPDIPLFLRIPSPPLIRKNFDLAFYNGEILATLWSVGASLRSPCINRPTFYGVYGRSSIYTSINEFRALSKIEKEIFSRNVCTPDENNTGRLAVQDTFTYDTSYYPAIPNGVGPYRSRNLDNYSSYEIVVVVNESALRSTSVPLEHLELEKKSLTIFRRLCITFGVIIWYISDDRSLATIASIDSFPTMKHVQYVWPFVRKSLMESLIR
jgi:hypothetical protein